MKLSLAFFLNYINDKYFRYISLVSEYKFRFNFDNILIWNHFSKNKTKNEFFKKWNEKCIFFKNSRNISTITTFFKNPRRSCDFFILLSASVCYWNSFLMTHIHFFFQNTHNVKFIKKHLNSIFKLYFVYL